MKVKPRSNLPLTLFKETENILIWCIIWPALEAFSLYINVYIYIYIYKCIYVYM